MTKTPPTWQLILYCAEELTARGDSPFTRKQLIECVQTKEPSRLPGTINPVIQGMTVNLRGGPTGGGRRSLRRVSRGKFVLSAPGTYLDQDFTPPPQPRKRPQESAGDLGQFPTTEIAGLPFRRICQLKLQRDPGGLIRQFMPQSNYQNREDLPLNRYGQGPFCRFRIPADFQIAGVYIISRNGTPLYIGECENFSNRFNAGYGQISPRNCFKGGQETNCRINALVLREIQAGSSLELYFHPCEDYKELEERLRREVRPEWNRI